LPKHLEFQQEIHSFQRNWYFGAVIPPLPYIKDMSKSNPAPIRVLLVDDHHLFLAGLRSLIEGETGLLVVGEAANRLEALEAARTHPDIILLDLDLGNEDSLDFLPDLLRVAEPARILIVTGVPDPELHLRAVRLGAMGVVLKVEVASLLFKAIRKVHSGEVWLNRSMVATVMTELLHAPSRKTDPEAVKIASLTGRELEVIGLLSEGRRNKQIAERLFISEKTVRHYLTSIFGKLAVSDRLELMIYSYKHGLVKLPAPPPRPGTPKAYSTTK
jgi:DNA-binding NarL/FixJ family response regulator